MTIFLSFDVDIDFFWYSKEFSIPHEATKYLFFFFVKKSHTLRIKIYKARNNNNNSSKNGNSSSSLPAIRTNKFNFFFLYELLARRWVCGTFFILCFMSTKTTTTKTSFVSDVCIWVRNRFFRKAIAAQSYYLKKLKNAFSQEFLSDLMMREQAKQDTTTTTLKTMSTATISYQNIQIYVRGRVL